MRLRFQIAISVFIAILVGHTQTKPTNTGFVAGPASAPGVGRAVEAKVTNGETHRENNDAHVAGDCDHGQWSRVPAHCQREPISGGSR